MKKAIILHCNPDEHCIAAEVQLIKKYRSKYTIDSINLNKLTKHLHPDAGPRDYIYEKIDNKYNRFIKANINGEDMTEKIRYESIKIDLPYKIKEVRKIKINEASIGLAALSTAASYSKCVSENSEDYGEYLADALNVALASCSIGLSLIKLNYEVAIIFNGRFAISRPIAEILRSANSTDILYYEFDDKRMQLMESWNSTFVPEEFSKRIAKITHIDHKLANDFFLKKQQKKWNEIEYKIRLKQVIGKFPEDLLDKKYVVFFTSSPDEYFAITDKVNLTEEFTTQYDIALQLAEKCIQKEYICVIRMHPNLRFKHKSWEKQWDFKKLKELKCNIIWPESEMDTYAILKNAHIVFTAGSTIGIEAAYLNKYIANVGKSLATHMRCAVEINTKNDLDYFINKPYFNDDAFKSALACGHYFSNQNDLRLEIKYINGIATINSKIISRSKFLLSRFKYIKSIIKKYRLLVKNKNFNI